MKVYRIFTNDSEINIALQYIILQVRQIPTE